MSSMSSPGVSPVSAPVSTPVSTSVYSSCALLHTPHMSQNARLKSMLKEGTKSIATLEHALEDERMKYRASQKRVKQLLHTSQNDSGSIIRVEGAGASPSADAAPWAVELGSTASMSLQAPPGASVDTDTAAASATSGGLATSPGTTCVPVSVHPLLTPHNFSSFFFVVVVVVAATAA